MASNYQVVFTMQYYSDFESIVEYYLEKFKNKDLIDNLEK